MIQNLNRSLVYHLTQLAVFERPDLLAAADLMAAVMVLLAADHQLLAVDLLAELLLLLLLHLPFASLHKLWLPAFFADLSELS